MFLLLNDTNRNNFLLVIKTIETTHFIKMHYRQWLKVDRSLHDLIFMSNFWLFLDYTGLSIIWSEKQIQFPCNTKIRFWSTFRSMPKFGQKNHRGFSVISRGILGVVG